MKSVYGSCENTCTRTYAACVHNKQRESPQDVQVEL